ncbi:hypothetical protein niasHT_001396 [Heterodera trifolii]|uniref:ShKT domain-containing protein n=1 Tax=Heterodera trifolii TaxID=157864 RepID=A0ABD2LQS1_9BILA
MNKNCFACGTDECPIDCEDKYKCKDRSELCKQMEHQCENFFFRKCMRCACPKTCGVCGSDNYDSPRQMITNSSTSTQIPTTTTTSTDLPTPIFTTQEFVFSTEPSTPFLMDLENSSILSTSPTTEMFNATIEVISDEEFKNPAKMKCKSCDAKRKKLAEIYEKYYPKE